MKICEQKMREDRKRKIISIEEKRKALLRLEVGKSAKKIVNELGVGESTICDWKKNRNETEKLCTYHADNFAISSKKKSRKRKTLKTRQYK